MDPTEPVPETPKILPGPPQTPVAGAVAAIIAAARLVASRVGPATRAVAHWARTALLPALRQTASRLAVVARRGWARLDPRERVGVLGGAGLVVVVAIVFATLGHGGGITPGPSASPAPSAVATVPTPSPAPSPTLSPADMNALLWAVLPTPATTDTVLLVGDAAALDTTEQGWLTDLRSQLGKVDAVAYRDATAERLGGYLVVFVIGQSPDLDVTALATARAAGATVHLVGPAAMYRAQILAATP